MKRETHLSQSEIFAATYFIYFCGYCLFSSFLVPYLAQRGYSAGFTGVVMSLSLLASLLVQPLAGYLTDTWISLQCYLSFSVLGIALLAAAGDRAAAHPATCLLLCTALSALSYPFGQLMDAWVDAAHVENSTVIYSRIRGWGSLGYAIMAACYGKIVSRIGYESYFYVQAACFIFLLPLLWRLFSPQQKNKTRTKAALSFWASCAILLGKKEYRTLLALFTLYWMSHRPIGSYFALIVRQRGGTASLYGLICAVGATAECLMLFALAKHPVKQKQDAVMQLVLLSGLIRPAVMIVSANPGWLMLAQVVQSLAFAAYYTISVAAFSAVADPRIHTISVAAGLTTSSVLGTTAANLAGGALCDAYGVASVLWFSFLLCIATAAFYFLFARRVLKSPSNCYNVNT